VLCDLSRLADDKIIGNVWLRMAMLVMKHIVDPQLAEQLPGIFELCRELQSKRTVLEYLEVLLRYLSAAATTVTDHDLRCAIATTLPTLEEPLMATMAEVGLEEGRVEGEAKGMAKGVLIGQRQILLSQLELRFGKVPATYRNRLDQADSDTLLEWSRRLLSAQSFKEVFEQ